MCEKGGDGRLSNYWKCVKFSIYVHCIVFSSFSKPGVPNLVSLHTKGVRDMAYQGVQQRGKECYYCTDFFTEH